MLLRKIFNKGGYRGRFLELPRKMNAGLAAIALGTYITCCGINWSWQLYAAQRLVHRGHSATVAIYTGFIMMVVSELCSHLKLPPQPNPNPPIVLILLNASTK